MWQTYFQMQYSTLEKTRNQLLQNCRYKSVLQQIVIDVINVKTAALSQV